jgi:hypothetical protein
MIGFTPHDYYHLSRTSRRGWLVICISDNPYFDSIRFLTRRQWLLHRGAQIRIR